MYVRSLCEYRNMNNSTTEEQERFTLQYNKYGWAWYIIDWEQVDKWTGKKGLVISKCNDEPVTELELLNKYGLDYENRPIPPAPPIGPPNN